MAVNQQAIDRVKLDEAFATGTYRPFNECWTVRMDSSLMVIDDDVEKFSRFTDNPDDEQKALMVINENNRQIVLLSIDNKLIKEHVGGICDCALFDDKQFRFVEFKTNAYGNSPEQVRETFDKATSQLKETILVFKDKLQKVDIVFEDVDFGYTEGKTVLHDIPDTCISSVQKEHCLHEEEPARFLLL